MITRLMAHIAATLAPIARNALAPLVRDVLDSEATRLSRKLDVALAALSEAHDLNAQLREDAAREQGLHRRRARRTEKPAEEQKP